jgi:PIN domain nuclease of toxin-antitoxin system
MILLDTHIWLWWVIQEQKRLPEQFRARLEDTGETLAVSAASVYELSYLVERGRIALSLSLDNWLDLALEKAGISVISVSAAIARRAAGLKAIHGDPVDRILIATAVECDANLMSFDGKFSLYPELSGRLITGL